MGSLALDNVRRLGVYVVAPPTVTARPIPPLRVAIVDAQPLFRTAICWTLSRIRPDVELFELGRLSSAIALLRRQPVSLVLLDDKLPDSHLLEGLKTLRAQFPGIPVAMLSTEAGALAERRARAGGAFGFVPKCYSIDEMEAALTALTERAAPSPRKPAGSRIAEPLVPGDYGLTPAQARVLSLVEQGQLNKQIAHEMGITEATVKAHVSAIFRKLGVQNRVQAIIAAGRMRGEETLPGRAALHGDPTSRVRA